MSFAQVVKSSLSVVRNSKETVALSTIYNSFKSTSGSNDTHLYNSDKAETGSLQYSSPGIIAHAKQLADNNITTSLCPDSSFSKYITIQNSYIAITSATKTADGGLLIGGETIDSTIINSNNTFAFLIKANSNGEMVWIRQFQKATNLISATIFRSTAFELDNADIIFTTLIDTISTINRRMTLIYRLTSAGDIIWKSQIKTTISAGNSPPSSYTYNVTSATNGLNGDVILSGWSYSNLARGFHTVIRLNSSGQLVWDANFGNGGPGRLGAEGVSAFIKNGEVISFGLSHGGNSSYLPVAITILRLNYATGELISKRFFRPSYTDFFEEAYKSFSYGKNQLVRLHNGNYLFYGTLASASSNHPLPVHLFGVVEFDPDFNLVDAYTISSHSAGIYAARTDIYIDETGKGISSIFRLVSGPGIETNVHISTFYKKQFQKQRKTYYPTMPYTGNTTLTYLTDSSYVSVLNYMLPNRTAYYEFRKMHNSDTASTCIGSDSALLHFRPLNMIEQPGYFYFDPNIPNQFVQTPDSISISTSPVVEIANCNQKSFCDSVAIHGNALVCTNGIFTAFKNKACGSAVFWSIDEAAIDTFYIINDTTISINFPNTTWSGYLYATLPATSCSPAARDSFLITIFRTAPQIDLGPDATICGNNTIVLHAGPSYETYQWQNGTTDSTFTVQSPGTYYVATTDVCGNHYSDTIVITTASFPFSAGPDKIRCSNEVVSLSATAGYANYTWSPDYYINTTAGTNVSVNPPVDTSYIVTAVASPGCTVRDTVRITVQQSPVIYLGADTVICSNAASLTLDAGAGFINYVWNNGSSSQTLIVNTTNMYHVTATTSNNCVSRDSIQVTFSQPPLFTIGRDTTLCAGETLQYNFSVPSATYLWQNGSTSNQQNITLAGQYILAVTTQGCTAYDTVIVGFNAAPDVDLGPDTTLCENETILLTATFPGAVYLWQDNSTGNNYMVSQPGQYFVRSAIGNCTSKDTIRIDYANKPTVSLGADILLCQGQFVLLNPVVTNVTEYLWQDNSTLPYMNATRSGLYRVVVSNTCGNASDSIYITEGFCSVMLPNTFTPNNDGLNDIFRIKYPFTVKSFQMAVYNRQGQRIFLTDRIETGWDGTYKGMLQETGNYVWIINVKTVDDQTQQLKGNILLLR